MVLKTEVLLTQNTKSELSPKTLNPSCPSPRPSPGFVQPHLANHLLSKFSNSHETNLRPETASLLEKTNNFPRGEYSRAMILKCSQVPDTQLHGLCRAPLEKRSCSASSQKYASNTKRYQPFYTISKPTPKKKHKTDKTEVDRRGA